MSRIGLGLGLGILAGAGGSPPPAITGTGSIDLSPLGLSSSGESIFTDPIAGFTARYKGNAIKVGGGAPGNGDDIEEWSDIGASGFDLVNVIANQPSWKTGATPTGNPAVVVNRANSERLVCASAMSNFITSSAGTSQCVVKILSYSSDAAASYDNEAIWSEPSQFVGLHLKATGETAIAYNWDGNDDHADANLPDGEWHVVTWRHSGGNIEIKIDNNSWVTVASGNTTVLTAALQLGRGSTVNYADFEISELLFYNTGLSNSDVDHNVNYLLNEHII